MENKNTDLWVFSGLSYNSGKGYSRQVEVLNIWRIKDHGTCYKVGIKNQLEISIVFEQKYCKSDGLSQGHLGTWHWFV